MIGDPRRPRARVRVGQIVASTVAMTTGMTAWLGTIPPARAQGAGAGRTLTVEDAITLALAANPRLEAARARREAADAQASSTTRRMLPSVHVNDELQRWDSPFVVEFAIPGAPAGGGLQARDATTNTFTAALNQPLLGLLRLDRQRRAGVELDGVAASEVAKLEADVRELVESQYLRCFEAQSMEHIAAASASELETQAQVARARVASGVLTNADVLRIEVAVANARQQMLQARSQATAARVGLLAAVGLDARETAGDAVTLVEPTALLAAVEAPVAPLPALLARAHESRPELALRKHQAAAAKEQTAERGFALLPEVNLEAAYLRVDGQAFAPKNSAFVGLRADWAIWEWGATERQHKAAAAQATAAEREAEATAREIEADVATTAAAGEAARGAMTAADQAIASAEEAFRVTQAAVQAGVATTTDLLESQAALTQSRLNLVRARYELALAQVGLRHAAGGDASGGAPHASTPAVAGG